MKKLFLLVLMAICLTGCVTVIKSVPDPEPGNTIVIAVDRLIVGMTKAQSLLVLKVFPYKIDSDLRIKGTALYYEMWYFNGYVNGKNYRQEFYLVFDSKGKLYYWSENVY